MERKGQDLVDIRRLNLAGCLGNVGRVMIYKGARALCGMA